MRYAAIKTLTGALLALVLSFGFTACNNQPSDEELQQTITDSLQANTAMKNVAVAVEEGVVTVSGNCEGEGCVTKTEETVKNIEGVKSVNNNVTMTEPDTDLTLRTQVQSIISKYDGIQADVAGGIVVLRGSINRSQLQPLMTELGTLGAAKIDNQLAVH